jgi:hypothetical protein
LRTTLNEFWQKNLSTTEEIAFKEFSKLLYWQRYWVAQELALAKIRTLLYGSGKLHFEVLATLHADDVPHDNEIGFGLQNSFDILMAVEDCVIQRHLNNSDDDILVWVFAMRSAGASLCSEVRDKVFGIQSLFPPECRVEVDYSLSPREVYMSVIKLAYIHLVHTNHNHKYKYRGFLEGVVDLAMGMGFAIAEDLITIIRDLLEDYNQHLEDVEQMRQEGEIDQVLKWEEVKKLVQEHVLIAFND